MSGTQGLRERKKEATRLALHLTAARLTEEHGLDNVTVEAIADAAEVSRRTFSNYFAHKEDALLYNHQRRLARLLELIESRPKAETGWTALVRAAREFTAEHSTEEDWASTLRLVRDNPSLRQAQIAAFGATEATVAGLIALRIPTTSETDLRARLMAARFLTTIRIATAHWLEGREHSLNEAVETALRVSGERLR